MLLKAEFQRFGAWFPERELERPELGGRGGPPTCSEGGLCGEQLLHFHFTGDVTSFTEGQWKESRVLLPALAESRQKWLQQQSFLTQRYLGWHSHSRVHSVI